jgi:hypothetical protein
MLPSSSPSHYQSKRSNGLGSNYSFSEINWKVIASLLWLVISLGAVVYGIRYNYVSYYSYDLKCDRYQCIFIKHDDHDKSITFERSMIYAVDLVKMKDGEVYGVVPSNDDKNFIPREFSVQLSLSGTLHADHHNDVPKPFLIRPPTHSKSRCNTDKRKLDNYRTNKVNDLHLRFSASITVHGIMLILFGTASALLSIVAGQWSDPTKKRLKKLS